MPVPLNLLLQFLVGSILVNVVPGPDMALVMRQVFLGGTALAYRTIAGNMTGIVVHATALTVGLSALLVASAEAYTVVKLAGAAYLVFLGAQSLWSAWRARHDAVTAQSGDDPVAGVRSTRVPTMRAAYLQGLISTVLNPKPALLFVAYVPQFVDATRPVAPQIAFLTAVHIAIGVIWMVFYARVVARAHRTLTRADVKRWLEAATGTVLILLGLRVALEQR